MHSKLIGYRLLGTFARRICAPDFTRNLFCYLGILVDASAWIRMVFVRTARRSPLLRFILVVVVNGAEPEMLRVYARRIVALMQHAHSFWDTTVSDNEGQPVAKHYPAIMRSFAITPFGSWAFPYPTITRLVNAVPKPGLPLRLAILPFALSRATDVLSRFQTARYYVEWCLAHSAFCIRNCSGNAFLADRVAPATTKPSGRSANEFFAALRAIMGYSSSVIRSRTNSRAEPCSSSFEFGNTCGELLSAVLAGRVSHRRWHVLSIA